MWLSRSGQLGRLRLLDGDRWQIMEVATAIRFASDMSWVQVGEDESTKVSFKANRTSKGTVPEGSEWSKNPIPNCAGLGGGYMDPDASCPGGLQFPAPAPGLFGQGANIHPGVGLFQWTLMDELEVPADLEPGDYVLSFRFESPGGIANRHLRFGMHVP